ncbi:hypothetical protein [Actinomadura sediminis]|uniref:Uncharacterized protein n=1 Tax=Actinomadura sediminis TaxID=1038904 RepID=A0ABW3EZU2_9ACTN
MIGETARQVAIRADDGLTRFGSVTRTERNRLWEAMLPMKDDGPAGALSEAFGPAVGPYGEVLKHLLKEGEFDDEGCTAARSTPGRIRALGPAAGGSPTALAIWEDLRWRSVVDETIVHLPAAEAERVMARRISEDCHAYERPDGLRAELYADNVTEKPGRSRRVTIFTLTADNGEWRFEYQSMTRIGDYVVLLNVSPHRPHETR